MPRLVALVPIKPPRMRRAQAPIRRAWLTHSKPLDPWDLRTAAAVILPAAFLLPVLPGHPGLACPLRTLTGIPCPLCGMTTSVEATVRLHLRDALAANPAGVVVALAAVALLAVRPRRLVLPSLTVPVALAATWLFELHRYGFV